MAENGRTKQEGLLGSIVRAAMTGRLPIPGAQLLPAVNAVVTYGARQVAAPRPVNPRPAAAGARRPTAATSAQRQTAPISRALKVLDDSPVAKAVVGHYVRQAALAPGALRGAWETVKEIPEDLAFLSRLTPQNFFTPTGELARRQLATGVMHMAEEAQDAIAHPEATRERVKRAFQNWRATVDHTATPQADTLLDEVRRSWKIGLNQGELGFDVGSLFYGGAELKGLRGMRLISGQPTAANFMRQGVPKELADYFALPYEGGGHHYLPRRTRLPEALGGGPVPKIVSESPFFLLKPRGITNGEMFKLHFEADPHYYGGNVKAGYPVRGWSGRKLGWETHGPLGRYWNGAPLPLKMAVTSPLYFGAGVATNMLDSGEDIE